MKILVTGGAGYIGSHVLKALKEAGHEPVVLDDMRGGHREAVPGAPLIVGDVGDESAIEAAFVHGPFDGIIHLAASCLVGESMKHPGGYYDNNVARGLRLLDQAVERRGVRRFVFSSTAAVYGEPSLEGCQAIDEDRICLPTSVYGETKLAFERALHWYCRRRDLQAVSLRYFNAAGADPAGGIGEDHLPETHLVPLVMGAALGRIPHVTVLGSDYRTPDGTCLRDYIHVSDLAAAHVLAMESAPDPDGSMRIYNLGAEKATSVLEVIEAARRITGREIRVKEGARRPGDPPVLRASSSRIRKDLGWSPHLSDLDTILSTAWDWHKSHPEGFRTLV